MPKPEAQCVPCLRCNRGRNGDRSCASGARARTLAGGSCFLGAWLPDKVPGTVNGIRVEKVDAPSYIEARRQAEQAGYREWIWVHNGVPGESTIGRYS